MAKTQGNVGYPWLNRCWEDKKKRIGTLAIGVRFPSYGFSLLFPRLLAPRRETEEEPRQGRDVSDLSRVEKIQFKMAAQI